MNKLVKKSIIDGDVAKDFFGHSIMEHTEVPDLKCYKGKKERPLTKLMNAMRILPRYDDTELEWLGHA